jgi:hypothetical protein
MKKIFTLVLLAAGLTFTASAQNRNDRYNNQDGYQVKQSDQNRNSGYNNQGGYSDQQQSKNYAYNDRSQSKIDYRSQGQYERTNQGYEKRNDGYGNDRSFNRYDRDKRMPETEHGSQQKAKAFGTGMVVGGLAVALLGALFSHGN